MIQGATPVEYVEETSFGELVTDPNMQWVGYVTDYESVNQINSKRYPKVGANNNVSTFGKNVEQEQDIDVSMTFRPQGLDFLKYFTGTLYGIADTVIPIQFGEQADGQYRRVYGCLGETLTMGISEDSIATADASFLSIDYTDWSTTDYVGAGSHATENTDSPLTFDDVSDIQYGGVPFDQYVSGITLNIENSLTVFTSVDSNRPTEIISVKLDDREVTVDLDIKFADIAFSDEILNFEPKTLRFTIGGVKFILYDVQFPEFENATAPSQLMGMEISSEPASDLEWNIINLDVHGSTANAGTFTTSRTRSITMSGSMTSIGEFDLGFQTPLVASGVTSSTGSGILTVTTT